MTLRLILGTWHRLARWHRLRLRLVTLRRAERRHRVNELITRLNLAALPGRSSEAWWLARRLAGTCVGLKKRQLLHSPTILPITGDWHTHLAQPGARGGCSAQILWHGSDTDLVAFWRLRDLLMLGAAQPHPDPLHLLLRSLA
eukprot:6000139-Heterocapsa_arctica.AAC.1